MNDPEEDYMSNNIIVDCQNVRPSLLINREKRKHEQFKKKQEAQSKKHKTVNELEKENRDKGLNTAIPADNKGFQLLEKMGFKSGDSLGKTKTGLKEPIDIVFKEGTSGVGRESHLKESYSRRMQKRVYQLMNFEDQFKLANRERSALSLIKRDFHKAQRVCEELDLRNKVMKPIDDFYWTSETLKKMKKVDKAEDGQMDSIEDLFNEEFERNVNTNNLMVLIDYIRTNYFYCIYCLITGNDEQDLRENCPGPYRKDHDDELLSNL